MVNLVRELAGEALVLGPNEPSLHSSEVGVWVEKYCRIGDITAEEHLRAVTLAWDLTSSAFGGHKATYLLLAHGTPFAQSTEPGHL